MQDSYGRREQRDQVSVPMHRWKCARFVLLLDISSLADETLRRPFRHTNSWVANIVDSGAILLVDHEEQEVVVQFAA